jgi:hypothetical protein
VEKDGTGIPVVRKESEGRVGKQDGQPAHTESDPTANGAEEIAVGTTEFYDRQEPRLCT